MHFVYCISLVNEFNLKSGHILFQIFLERKRNVQAKHQRFSSSATRRRGMYLYIEMIPFPSFFLKKYEIPLEVVCKEESQVSFPLEKFSLTFRSRW
jgi:hypothetical protein